MACKQTPASAGEVTKRRRRRSRTGTRANRRRERKSNAANLAKAATPVECAVHSFLLRYQTSLRKVPAHLPPKVHAGPPSKRVKRVSWRDEENGGGGGGGDPAVLALGPVRRPLTYTRDELLRLRNSPLVKRGLDPALRNSDVLALVLRKRPDSPNDDDRGARGDAPNDNNHKGLSHRERRTADPRERVRRESDGSGAGIVLSPQRRSFTSGCGAPAPRTDSPPPAAHAPAPPSAKPDHVRRIGSGRIMVRDMTTAPWERGTAEEEERRSEPYRPPPMERARHQSDRFERRSFGRDTYNSDIKREREERFTNDKHRDRDDNRRSGSGRFTQRRYEKEEEPEWFSGGPTSQLETIELRGFDEPKRNGTANSKEEKWGSNGNSTSSSNKDGAHSPDPDTSNDKDSGVESKAGEETAPSNEQPDFNLDEFLKFDNIPDVLTNGTGEAEGGSRFSRWFRRESPTNDNGHYERLLHHMVNDLEISPSRVPPTPVVSEQQHVFAPISPALAHPQRPPSLLELLRRANVDERPQQDMNSVGGKMQSLEELEARLRPQQTTPPHPENDLSAFNRLIAQVSGGHAVLGAEQRPPPPPQPQPQPMSLLQMLNKSMEPQKPQQPPQAQQPHIPQELVYKLLQLQRQQQTDMNAAMPNVAPPDRDLLQRPEAQAIIHGLKAGEITVQHLMQQLSNPGLQSRHRELLHTILRLHHQHRQQPGGSPLPGAAPHLVVPPHHQPLRLSPLPHQGVPARIPSPRELVMHTQSIMQSALIKKKLEEQRENYRRRHDAPPPPHPHAHAHAHAHVAPKQPTPISFTPTAVLRKMTADKEPEAPSPKQQQWAQPHKMPQGRPIVKGNQSGAAPPMSGFTPTPNDYQQHYLNQQQQMVNAIRPFPHQQPRQMPQAQMNNNMNNMTRGVPGGTTLHQLLVQSHQRTLNEMTGGGMNARAGGGDNQLARWFSPELLARASAGKLPSLRVPNALSLEELERHHSPAVKN